MLIAFETSRFSFILPCTDNTVQCIFFWFLCWEIEMFIDHELLWVYLGKKNFCWDEITLNFKKNHNNFSMSMSRFVDLKKLSLLNFFDEYFLFKKQMCLDFNTLLLYLVCSLYFFLFFCFVCVFAHQSGFTSCLLALRFAIDCRVVPFAFWLAVAATVVVVAADVCATSQIIVIIEERHGPSAVYVCVCAHVFCVEDVVFRRASWMYELYEKVFRFGDVLRF